MLPWGGGGANTTFGQKRYSVPRGIETKWHLYLLLCTQRFLTNIGRCPRENDRSRILLPFDSLGGAWAAPRSGSQCLNCTVLALGDLTHDTADIHANCCIKTRNTPHQIFSNPSKVMHLLRRRRSHGLLSTHCAHDGHDDWRSQGSSGPLVAVESSSETNWYPVEPRLSHILVVVRGRGVVGMDTFPEPSRGKDSKITSWNQLTAW